MDPLLFGCSGSHVYLLCAFGRRDRPRFSYDSCGSISTADRASPWPL
ncbi:UNVERIFIED_ORG: hypothetical protein QOE_1484 [Clostridioides difficile F501]